MQSTLEKHAVPAYERIERKIHEQIRAGHLKPYQKLKSPEALAQEWGISSGTVRHSLQILAARGLLVRKQGEGTFVNHIPAEETRQAAAKITTKTLALLVPNIARPEYALLSRAIEDACHDQGLDLVARSTDDDPEKYAQILHRKIESGMTFGIIMVPPFHANLSLEAIKELNQSNIPVVTCYRSVSLTGWPLICNDVKDSFRFVVDHLREIGRKRIAFIGFSRHGKDDFQNQHYYFIEAMAHAGLPIDFGLKLVIERSDCLEDPAKENARLMKLVQTWLTENPDIDGIYCAGDDLASIAIKILRRLGKRVPDDVAVTGDGNFGAYYGFAPQEITTVDACFNTIGQKACEMLFAMHNGTKYEPDFVEKVQCKLVLGESTMGGKVHESDK